MKQHLECCQRRKDAMEGRRSTSLRCGYVTELIPRNCTKAALEENCLNREKKRILN